MHGNAKDGGRSLNTAKRAMATTCDLLLQLTREEPPVLVSYHPELKSCLNGMNVAAAVKGEARALLQVSTGEWWSDSSASECRKCRTQENAFRHAPSRSGAYSLSFLVPLLLRPNPMRFLRALEHLQTSL